MKVKKQKSGQYKGEHKGINVRIWKSESEKGVWFAVVSHPDIKMVRQISKVAAIDSAVERINSIVM